MATNRPANLELVQQGGGTSRPTLTRGGANPQMSISDGQLLSPTSTVKRRCTVYIAKYIYPNTLVIQPYIVVTLANN